MIYKEAISHKTFECEVRFRLEKPTFRQFVFKHLILDCGIDSLSRGLSPVISTFSQAEATIIEWINSGRWINIWGNDKDREEWSKYINDSSAFGEIEIIKMERTWYYFLQNPQDFINRPNVFWIQVNSNIKINYESRLFTDKERILVAIPATKDNQNGFYMFTDEMKEQALSIVRNYYSYTVKREHPEAIIESSIAINLKDCVVCV